MYSIIHLFLFSLHKKNNKKTVSYIRNIAIKNIRNFFEIKGFLEINNKLCINSISIESNTLPIKLNTKIFYASLKYLQTSPELLLKKYISIGIQNNFQISPVFRQEYTNSKHMHEFFLIEWYRSKSYLNKILYDFENIIECLFRNIINYSNIYYFHQHILFLQITSLYHLFLYLFNVNLINILCIYQKKITKHFISLLHKKRTRLTIELSINFILIEYINRILIKKSLTVIIKWPIQMAGLSHVLSGIYLFSERIEIYFKNIELANGYNELLFPKEQLFRFFLENKKLKKCLFLTNIDDQFINKLKNSITLSGIAVGFERTLMFLLNKNHISELYNFF